MAQTHSFRGTARTIVTVPGQGRFYSYHRTAVVVVREDGTIRLDSGGWKTRTTLIAMNQASNQDCLKFRVFQRDGDWFVHWQDRDVPFVDGMVLTNVPVEIEAQALRAIVKGD